MDSLQELLSGFKTLEQRRAESAKLDLLTSSEAQLASTERLSREIDDILRDFSGTTICANSNFREFMDDNGSIDDDDIQTVECTPQSEPIQTETTMTYHAEDEMAIPFQSEEYEGEPIWDSYDDESDLEPDMPTDMPVRTPEKEMAIPSPHILMSYSSIEEEIQRCLDAPWREDGLTTDGELDHMAVVNEIEKLLRRDTHLQTTPQPCPRKSGKYSFNCIYIVFPVCKSVLGQFSKFLFSDGLRNWKTTPSLAKSRNKCGKGDFDIPFDNG